jgi:hypothetical protein
MVNTFFTERKTIKNNVLFAEVIQIKNKTNINFRTVRMGIKGIQIPNNSNDEERDNNLKIYLNLKKTKTDITAARVKSVKEKDSKMLPSSAIKIIKNKIFFKKKWLLRKYPALINIYSELSRKIYGKPGNRIFISLFFRILYRSLF